MSQTEFHRHLTDIGNRLTRLEMSQGSPILETPSPYLTVREVCHLFKCSKVHVHELIKRGELRVKRAGGKVLIYAQDVLPE